MKIDKDSKGTILAAWAICLVLFLLFCLLVHAAWARWIAGILLGIVALFSVYFFRIPERQARGSEKVITSVADGEVVIIDKKYEDEYLNRDCIRLCIYMDFMNVHANFWPVTGEVVYGKYHPGKHKLAFLPKSSDLNEHATTVIRTPDGHEILFKQIAGTFARRVVSYSRPGLEIRAGEQCGVIKLGSRIDIFLPLDAQVEVEEGAVVRACETIIARI